ncbi:hypothetical protein VE02_03182 [Pseudogymnoascus sp. 03VT05]|nr:hypothetical protein VE02_03182 [Pseudogymnoascus sp. 03VT05]
MAAKRNPLPGMQLSGGNRPSLRTRTSDATVLRGGVGEMVPRHESDLTLRRRRMDLSTIGWRMLRRKGGRERNLLQVSDATTGNLLNNYPLIALPQTRGVRRASPERFDETVADGRTHREKRRDSSDSSLIQPAYERENLPQREKTIGEFTSEDQTRHFSKKAKKHRQPASSTTDDSQSEPDRSQRKETFEKRSRHKTKDDRYESKKARKHVDENEKPAKRKTIKVKRGDAVKASRKAAEDLINGFRPKNVSQDRLTIRPGTGIFKNGRASSPSRNRGLPDLAFSEMQFLKQSSRKPPESEREVIISKSGQKTKRERERARNEISNYFVPVRQPLQEANINLGRESSILPSDGGKTEAISIARGHHSHPPVSPEKDQRSEMVLYEGFSTRRPSPQKFTLPKPKLDQIFVPRNTTASSKSTSYCTWSESVRSPIVRAKAMLADASRNRRGISPTSRQRIPVRADVYKEVGIQAELDSEVDSPYNPAVLRMRRGDEDTEVVMSKHLKVANTSSVRDVNDEDHTECQDEDRIHQFQADRAVLHDCEPHKGSKRPHKDNSGRLVESLHTKIPADPNHDADRAKEIMMEQCTQTDKDTVGRTDGSVPPGEPNHDLDVQYIMSRAVRAQQAYINRRSTPKVAVKETRGSSDVRALAADVSNARDSGALKGNAESLEFGLTGQHGDSEARLLFSGLDGGRRNEEASQSGQYQFHDSVPESNFPVHGQTQSEYIDAAGYQPHWLDDNGGYMTGEHGSHRIENIPTPEHIELRQLMIPTRGFSTGAVHIPPAQSRTISPFETMEPIYARQLQNQAFDAQEEQHDNSGEHGQSAVYLYEGGQWEREPLDAEAQEYNPTEMEDGQVNYGDIYEAYHDGLDLIDESMYYKEELPFDHDAQMHETATPADDMLFYTPGSGPGAEYQRMPRQRRYFSTAADQASGLGSWERVQTAAVPQELTMQFWRPRRGY